MHQQTGFGFPARIATAVRHHVTRYTVDGSDVGVDYQITRGDQMIAFVSVFVYPAPTLQADTPKSRTTACETEFSGIKRDLLSHEPTARLIQENEVAAPARGIKSKGLRASFSGGQTKFDGTERDVKERAELYCYLGGKWLVGYRVTSRADVDATTEVENLMRALRWPDAFN